MKKGVLTCLVLLALCGGTLLSMAWAAEVEEDAPEKVITACTDEEMEAVREMLEEELGADYHAMLYDAYVSHLFGMESAWDELMQQTGTLSTGADMAGAALNTKVKKAYDGLVKMLPGILAGTTQTNGLTVGAGGKLSEAEMLAALGAVRRDHPDKMYWCSLTVYTIPTDTGGTYYLPVVNDYAAKYEDGSFLTDTIKYESGEADTYNIQVDSDKSDRAAAAVENANAVVAAAQAKFGPAGEPAKVLEYFMRAVCTLTEYDNGALTAERQAAYGDAWQLVNVFDGCKIAEDGVTVTNDGEPTPATNVVCGGYSKAFQYLCDQYFTSSGADAEDTNTVQCYTVDGVMSGGTGAGAHMWNVVRIGGESYLVDVTNCDTPAVGAPHWLFLRGYLNCTPKSGHEIDP